MSRRDMPPSLRAYLTLPPTITQVVTCSGAALSPQFYLGLALGQSGEYTALAIVEQPGPGAALAYQLRHLERVALGTPDPAIVARVRALVGQPPLRGRVTVTVDVTGVGQPVFALVQQAQLGPPLHALTMTGGDVVQREGQPHRVPKRDLVSTLQVLLQTERLKVASALLAAQTLVRELLQFQTRISLAMNESSVAWREGAHDDLVFAAALACWSGEHLRPVRFSAAVAVNPRSWNPPGWG